MIKDLLKDAIRPLCKVVTNKNIREFYKLKSKNYPRYRPVYGVKFLDYKFDVPDFQSFVWQYKEIFVDELYKFETKSAEPVIYDCGANIGTSTLYFKIMYPNACIKAFEADPVIVKFLKKNLAGNISCNGIEIIDAAVWIDHKGVLFSQEGADGGSLYGSSKSVNVRSVRLRDLLAHEEYIDMLKIDIEGAEYEVVKDCADSLGNVNNIFIEYHSRKDYPQRLSEILNILEQNNFRYYIENLTKKQHPFTNFNNNAHDTFDLQLNIFATKKA